MKNTMKKTVAIPVEKLRPFDGHPFKVKDDEEMNTLIESIQTQGVLSPLIVRPIENTEEYEVVSGHRRLHAAQKAGITEVPALIYALDRDAAAIAVVDSNLHREHILPSEKAFAYKLKADACYRRIIKAVIRHRKRKGRSLHNRGCDQSLIRKYILMNGNGCSFRTFSWYARLDSNQRPLESELQGRKLQAVSAQGFGGCCTNLR